MQAQPAPESAAPRPRLHVLEAGWLAAALLVPLAMNPFGLSPFALPKGALLQVCAWTMALAALAGLAGVPRAGSGRSVLACAGLLALALLLASALSVDPRLSMMGSLERQQGLPVLLALLGMFVAVAAWMRSEAERDRLLSTLVWGSSVVVLYGLLQALGLDPLDWRSDAASPVQSTTGRANFLGSYLVLLIPLTITLWRRRPRRLSHAPYALLLAGQLVCLAATQARGAWLGFLAMAAVLTIGHALFSGRRYLAAGVAATALAFTLLLVFPQVPGPSAGPPADETASERRSALGELDRGSSAARLTVWRFTLPLIAERPMSGYGPETFHDVFVEVFPPQLVYYHGRGVAVDRAHNLWLDLAMSGGLLALAAFVLLLVAWSRLAWTGFGTSQRWLWLGLCAAVVGFLVEQQFAFAQTDAALVFWLVLGVGVAQARIADQASPPAMLASGTRWPRVAAVTLVALLIAEALALRPLRADMLAWQSRQQGVAVAVAIERAQTAVALAPREPAYRVQLSWLLLTQGQPEAARREILAAERLSPNDPRVVSAVGELHALWGRHDPGRLLHAEIAYRRTLELAPHVATYHTALGLVLTAQGRLEEGIRAVERAVDLDATDGVAYAHLATLYGIAGRAEEAARAAQEARRWGVAVEESPQTPATRR
jgi:O-antigen ligase